MWHKLGLLNDISVDFHPYDFGALLSAETFSVIVLGDSGRHRCKLRGADVSYQGCARRWEGGQDAKAQEISEYILSTQHSSALWDGHRHPLPPFPVQRDGIVPTPLILPFLRCLLVSSPCGMTSL